MADAAEIKREMQATGKFKPADLEFLTASYLEEFAKHAKELTKEQLREGKETGTPGEHIWNGNHFFIKGTTWNWEDTVGSQCGRTRKWTYKVNVGDTYRSAGNCPQAYPWTEMVLHYL